MSETGAKAYPMTIEVRNPADGKVVGEVPIETAETVAAKVRELRLFQHEWEAIGPKGPQGVAAEVPGLDVRQRRTHHRCAAVRDG